MAYKLINNSSTRPLFFSTLSHTSVISHLGTETVIEFNQGPPVSHRHIDFSPSSIFLFIQMSRLESDVPKISEGLKNGFVNFSNQLKAGEIPETFKSDETLKLEKLEDKLEMKKEVLESRIYQKKAHIWWHNLLLILEMVFSIFAITLATIFPPENETGPWPIIAFKIASVISLSLFGFAVFEGITEQIANCKRRRNAKNEVLLEDGNEKIGEIVLMRNEYDDLKNRYQKFFEDLNENYVPMWNRYKRLCNQYLFYVSFEFFFLFSVKFFSVHRRKPHCFDDHVL
ncbi:hypothetical protein B9Z55_029159 [Caenorhabditis nigoni]|uniref:Uncharacterized protein n=1 Tax=Caenorhabditis nigoni TaxID=1611254 RepID=A0A2G5S8B0_9PELO|nr:hypothetical protein B9Z55_029159 [Caenorhabditis nigoni]